MRSYKLLSGVEFTIPPAPIDARADALLAFIQRDHAADAKADGLKWTRDALTAILSACAPDILPKVTWADVKALDAQVPDMIDDAWGTHGGGADPKNSSAPGASANGCAPGSAVAESKATE